ncbi:glutathione S-transferase family protein [Piscinibacter sakaiensis]|uniref:Glutathione S-transferase n=1 Tax=Piscinibacter sakaiensis TaxID=1547922 RepID=A0A0K8NWQ1_PISS1|nr:glutathione S-transferase family protein [Piscinibacter sakaiensis]GAP34370.1 glutathione S-transferase [Piscinibacter sakaiensis]
MHEIILHHYPFSTFSEKVRVALGRKGLAWRSVEIAGLPPRPLLTPLTGGYRRAPVLQIGADIYCDTHCILPALEALQPQPSLYPPGSEGVAEGLGFAWERQLWIPSIGVLVHYIGEHIPPEFLKDRKEGYLYVDISKEAMAPQFAQHVQALRAQVAWLAQALAARPFLFGDEASAADLACWQTLYLLRKNCPPEVDALLGLEPLRPWYERIAAFGHGQPTPMSAEEAFAVARAAVPRPVDAGAGSGEDGWVPGARVVVTPDDNARVPVEGRLVAIDATRVTLHRHDPEAGDLHLHFPRLGFELRAA